MSDDEPAEEAPPPADAEAEEKPAPKPKKKKKRAAPARAEPRDDMPTFAATFPRDPELDALVQAFEQGNYAHVRSEAPALAKRTEDPDVRRAARELARRLEPDPIAVYLLIAAALLLVFLAAWFWSHPHEAPLPQ